MAFSSICTDINVAFDLFVAIANISSNRLSEFIKSPVNSTKTSLMLRPKKYVVASLMNSRNRRDAMVKSYLFVAMFISSLKWTSEICITPIANGLLSCCLPSDLYGYCSKTSISPLTYPDTAFSTLACSLNDLRSILLLSMYICCCFLYLTLDSTRSLSVSNIFCISSMFSRMKTQCRAVCVGMLYLSLRAFLPSATSLMMFFNNSEFISMFLLLVITKIHLSTVINRKYLIYKRVHNTTCHFFVPISV